MNPLRERVEVSIFSDSDKSIISTIMNPRVPNGIGEIMFNVVRDITDRCSRLTYTGPNFVLDLDETNRQNNAVYKWDTRDTTVDLRSCLYLFGGSAYQVHAANDDSRFAHILPGVHDIDVVGEFRTINPYDRASDNHSKFDLIAAPFERVCIDDLMKENVGDPLYQRGLLSFCLREMTRIIRTNLRKVYPKRFYYRRTKSSNMPDEVKIVSATLKDPTDVDDDQVLIHQEIVNEIFLLEVVDEGDMIKVQVEVGGALGDTVATDHVMEIVLKVDSTNVAHRYERKVIGGIVVESKKTLFYKNMKSAISRRENAIAIDQPGHVYRHLVSEQIGKCAQDILRIAYIILTDLDTDDIDGPGPWVHTPVSIPGLPSTAGRVKRTPIEHFIEAMQFLTPCIDRSGIGTFHLHEDSAVNADINPRASEAMGEMLKLFSQFSGEQLERKTKGTAEELRKTMNLRNTIFVKNPRFALHDFNRSQLNKYKEIWTNTDFDAKMMMSVFMNEIDQETREKVKYTKNVLLQNRHKKIYMTLDDTHLYRVKDVYTDYSRLVFLLDDNTTVSINHEQFVQRMRQTLSKTQQLDRIEGRMQTIGKFLFGGVGTNPLPPADEADY